MLRMLLIGEQLIDKLERILNMHIVLPLLRNEYKSDG
jgi:hypothetical protein